MTYEERKNMTTNIIQNVILENRGKLTISRSFRRFKF